MSLKNNRKIAFLTAGGIAPCLSASIGALIIEYVKKLPDVEMIGYSHGYKGLLLGTLNFFSATLPKGIEVIFFPLCPLIQSTINGKLATAAIFSSKSKSLSIRIAFELSCIPTPDDIDLACFSNIVTLCPNFFNIKPQHKPPTPAPTIPIFNTCL